MASNNKIKALYIWTFSLLFFGCLIIQLYQYHNIDSISVCFIISLTLGIAGLYIIQQKGKVRLFFDLCILNFIIFVSAALIYKTGGINSIYFPSIFLLALLYTSFILDNKHFIFSNIIGCSLIVLSILLFNQHIDKDNIIPLTYSILIYLSVVSVIRCYNSKCLLCSLEKESCSKQESCTLHCLKWNNCMELREDGISTLEKRRE